MRHRLATKHLGRNPSHRRAMRRNMVHSLFEHGAIRTTEQKAKHLRRFAERLITVAKKGTLHARRQVIREMQDRWAFSREGEELDQTIVEKLFEEIAPRYENRPGGYTRIIKLSDRRIGDAGSQVILQLVEESTGESEEKGARGSSRRRKRATKRSEALKAALSGKSEQPAATENAQSEQSEAEEEPATEEATEESQEASEQSEDAEEEKSE